MAYVKDPDATLDYVVDWSEWLAAGEIISTSSWIVPDGIDEALPSPSKTTTTTKIWLAGGTAGGTYRVTNRIVSSGGRTDDRTIMIRVTDR